MIKRKAERFTDVWPIHQCAKTLPPGWPGWPERKQFAFILTHDVETRKGHERCRQLAILEVKFGFRSSFNFVPKRYAVSPNLRHYLRERGFEIGVHGLIHDGKLYANKHTFDRRAPEINRYLTEWNSVGFRSPAMHHNLEWIQQLEIEYDCSTFDTDPFEPQSDGVLTIFPFFFRNGSNQKGYVELPYTLPQDFTLFILLGEKTIDKWKKKLDWVAENSGMALLNTHPDYMNFTRENREIDEYPVEYYRDFLEYVTHRYRGQYWHALPAEMANFWKKRVVQSA